MGLSTEYSSEYEAYNEIQYKIYFEFPLILFDRITYEGGCCMINLMTSVDSMMLYSKHVC